MSWHGGTAIFSPVAREMVKHVGSGLMSPFVATSVLTVLIHELRDMDWGDPEEGLWAFQDHAFVVKAFENNDITDEEEEEE
jgi:hypothetical protein